MVNYEVIFVDLPNPEASYEKCTSGESANQLQAISLLGIVKTRYELSEHEGKKTLKMYANFGLIVPKTMAKSAMENIARTLEAQNNCKIIFREL